jgi:hypothetical protein
MGKGQLQLDIFLQAVGNHQAAWRRAMPMAHPRRD